MSRPSPRQPTRVTPTCGGPLTLLRSSLPLSGSNGPHLTVVKSPFKAVAFKNQTHCGYISMSQLEPNKPYIMYEMRATHHATYGDGLLSFLRGKNNSQWRSQCPPKYLQEISIVIFREVLADKSCKIDLAPYSEEMANAH